MILDFVCALTMGGVKQNLIIYSNLKGSIYALAYCTILYELHKAGTVKVPKAINSTPEDSIGCLEP